MGSMGEGARFLMQKLERLIWNKTGLVAILLAAAITGFTTTADAGPRVDGDLLMGEISSHTVKKRESLFDIARKYGMGIIELQAANPGINPWQPKPGTTVTVTKRHLLPGITRDGIVINLASSRMFYFKGPSEVMTFPIAHGKDGWETPVAATTIVEKRLHPTWTPPASIRAENPDLPDFIPPGPDNPLGDYALALGLNGIMIHGTNAPSSIGRRASHGCIRMYPEDIKALFNAVKKGTPVLITKTPYVLGWKGNKLYLQVTPKVRAVTKSKTLKKPKPDKFLREAIEREAGPEAIIDWELVDEVRARADGIPAEIARRPFFGPPMPHNNLDHPQRASLTIINDSNISLR